MLIVTFRKDIAGITFVHLRRGRIRTLFEDRDRRLWVGTEGGLHLLRPESPTFELGPRKQ